jgi:hypothetical protein
MDPIYTILPILFLEQGYVTIFIHKSLFSIAVPKTLSKLSNPGYK